MEATCSELPDGVTESIFKRLPLESVARFCTVSKKWNNHLSAEQFLTWRRENIKEDPWLLLQVGLFYYRLNVTTKVLKVFPRNPFRLILASLGGLLLRADTMGVSLYNPLNGTGTPIPRMKNISQERVIVCNPVREAFVQLPMMGLNKDQGIMVGDILWKGHQYQVVGVDKNFIEVYDFSKKSWVVVQQLRPRCVWDLVFYKGFFVCIVRSFKEWGTMVFRIIEDCTCQMVHLFSLIPSTSHLSMPPQLLVCGSALVLVWQDSEELYLWELNYDSNVKITLKASWKAIPKMPQELMGFLNSDSYSQQSKYKWLAAGKYICVFREGSPNLVFFNTEDRSWSCFSVRDEVENFRVPISVRVPISAYAFEPRPDISFH